MASVSLLGSISHAALGNPVERMKLAMESAVGEDLADKSVSISRGADIELITFKAAKQNCTPNDYDNCVIIVSQLLVNQKKSSIPKTVKTWCANEITLMKTSDSYIETVLINEDNDCRYSQVIY